MRFSLEGEAPYSWGIEKNLVVSSLKVGKLVIIFHPAGLYRGKEGPARKYRVIIVFLALFYILEPLGV